jgi:hypothetical protein
MQLWAWACPDLFQLYYPQPLRFIVRAACAHCSPHDCCLERLQNVQRRHAVHLYPSAREDGLKNGGELMLIHDFSLQTRLCQQQGAGSEEHEQGQEYVDSSRTQD